MIAAGTVSTVGSAAATSPPQMWVNATGTIASPKLQTYTASSTGTSPAHVALTVTQSTAVGFTVKSVFSDSTAGATVISNVATSKDLNGFDEKTIPWGVQDGDVFTGGFDRTPGSYLVTDTVTDSYGATATAAIEVSTLGSAYSSVTPTRILDTRNGTGALKGKVGPGSIVKLHVEGAGPIPSSGVTAVVLHVTVVATTGGGYITVYPSGSGTTVPTVSSLNYSAGQVVANLVTVPVGSDGYVYLANSRSAPVDLIADVSGYYSLSGASLYEPAIPERVLDTRNGTGAAKGAVHGGGTVKLLVALGNTFLAPPGQMSAVAVNITVVNPTSGGYVTAYADGTSRPGTSNLNFTTGRTVANSAIVPVAANGEIDLTVTMPAVSSTNLLVDVVGYYSTSPGYADSSFVPIAPSRVFDSRKDGMGQFASGFEYDINLGAWAMPTMAIEMNATVTNTKSGGYLTLYTYGGSVPGTSNLNWSAGQTLANAAYVTANDANGWIAAYNGGSAGADVVLDVSGYFENSRSAP